MNKAALTSIKHYKYGIMPNVAESMQTLNDFMEFLEYHGNTKRQTGIPPKKDKNVIL